MRKSDDSAFLFGFGRVLLLQTQPQKQSSKPEGDDRHVERRTDGNENGFKRPLNEFRYGGYDFLRVHGS